VQELAAISFAVTASAEQAETKGQPQLAERLRTAATTVRASIGGLRSLLVDIYPPSLRTAGLVTALTALTDLASTLRSRNIDVRLDLPPADQPTRLDAGGEQLVFRVAQECLRNAARHAAAQTVDLRLSAEKGVVVLEISDDGVGFDSDVALRSSSKGHFGLRLSARPPTGAEAVEMALATSPHVVLMDLSMPIMDGVTATRALLEARPETAVVVLTSFTDHTRVAEALAAGRWGTSSKTAIRATCWPGSVRLRRATHRWTRGWLAACFPPAVFPTRHRRSATESCRCCAWSPRGWPTSRSVGHWASANTRSRSIWAMSFGRSVSATATSAAMWAREHLTEDPAS